MFPWLDELLEDEEEEELVVLVDVLEIIVTLFGEEAAAWLVYWLSVGVYLTPWLEALLEEVDDVELVTLISLWD